MVVKPKGLWGAPRMGIHLDQTDRGRENWRESHNGGGRESCCTQRWGVGGHGAPPPGWGVLASSLGPCLQIRKKFSGESCHQIYLSRCILFCSSPPSPLVGIIIFLNLVLIGEKFLDNVMLVSAIKQCRAAIVVVVVVQSLSHVQLFATPWTAAHQAPLSFTISPSLHKLNVHWVGDAIQPSLPLSSPSLPAFNLSQHQGLFQWISSSHQVAKVLELQLQHQSFWWILRVDLL